MDYTEYVPATALSTFVRCIWTLEGDVAELGDRVQPILPDGRPELVLHFGDAFERVYPGGLVERQPAILYAGQLTRQIELRPTGRIAVLGVRFHPDGAALLLPDRQHDLVGLTIEVDALARGLAGSLRAIRDSALSPARAVHAVQELLMGAAATAQVDRRVRHAVSAIGRAHGMIAVDVLAGQTGLTRRQLERRFNALVGISPKRLARIARFQYAMRTLDELNVPARGTRTAFTCGYADQAHFVREFRELSGTTPGAHLLQRAELTGFFGPGAHDDTAAPSA